MMPLASTNICSMIEEKPLTEEVSRNFISQLLSALEFMHFQGIVHRDVKPANLLVTDSSTLQLADFGIADRTPSSGYFDQVCGSESYMAPEMLGNGEESLSYHSAVDIWAVGVVTHEMLARRTPFRPWRLGEETSVAAELDEIERRHIR
ncbi:unnamed protein product, partial [Ascophyllum nodosum]